MLTGPDGKSVEVASPRLNAKDELMRVRALYLDIAQWAAEESARWGPWAVPCPISDDEIHKAKERKRRKARMDQRTRERLPVLPILISAVDRRRARPPTCSKRHGTPSPGLSSLAPILHCAELLPPRPQATSPGLRSRLADVDGT
ncbi:hypothetical protein [Streptomyces atratus]|uniref:hypothetical protein n=1 Tax=Streptomyces atratus TaxID=1893 RepID=UPI00224EB458|nr:hypothetical protein [Streptomyces atratus]MCX5338633.1 hypothetical protein [Streptomyces atratus]